MWTPILRTYSEKQHIEVWRIGPGIRECCIKKRNPAALVSWWLEVETRFAELEAVGLDDPELTAGVLASREDIMKMLEEEVPWPTQRMWDQYANDFVGVRRTASLLKPHLELLNVEWPCTQEALNQAWRTLAKTLHPDGGGNQEDFVRAQISYQKLTAALKGKKE